jgi:hypothetical protein
MKFQELNVVENISIRRLEHWFRGTQACDWMRILKGAEMGGIYRDIGSLIKAHGLETAAKGWYRNERGMDDIQKSGEELLKIAKKTRKRGYSLPKKGIEKKLRVFTPQQTLWCP